MTTPEGHRVCTVTETAHRLGCSDYLVREGIRRLRILATQSRKRGPWDVYLPDDSTALRALRGTLEELTARPPLELLDKQDEGDDGEGVSDGGTRRYVNRPCRVAGPGSDCKQPPARCSSLG